MQHKMYYENVCPSYEGMNHEELRERASKLCLPLAGGDESYLDEGEAECVRSAPRVRG